MRRAHDRAAPEQPLDHAAERQLDGDHPRGRRPRLPPIAREQPAHVHRLVIRLELDRRARQRRGVGEHALRRAVEVGVAAAPREPDADDPPVARDRQLRLRRERRRVQRVLPRQPQPAVLEELRPRRLDELGHRREVRRAARARIDRRRRRQPRPRRREHRRRPTRAPCSAAPAPAPARRDGRARDGGQDGSHRLNMNEARRPCRPRARIRPAAPPLVPTPPPPPPPPPAPTPAPAPPRAAAARAHADASLADVEAEVAADLEVALATPRTRAGRAGAP